MDLMNNGLDFKNPGHKIWHIGHDTGLSTVQESWWVMLGLDLHMQGLLHHWQHHHPPAWWVSSGPSCPSGCSHTTPPTLYFLTQRILTPQAGLLSQTWGTKAQEVVLYVRLRRWESSRAYLSRNRVWRQVWRKHMPIWRFSGSRTFPNSRKNSHFLDIFEKVVRICWETRLEKKDRKFGV